ncbi:GMC oxidoreductase [Alphaproteobacteria bacterium]|nr:GMC oxidoreductase [Alphaproteobacteria bacterium]
MESNKKTVVVIGAGTAGITIAQRLSQHFDVIVFESSRHKSYPLFFRIPLMIGFLFRDNRQKYITMREIKLGTARTIPFFESNVFGGASVINGCVHTFGSEKAWKSVLKNTGISIEDIKKSYRDTYTTTNKKVNKIRIKLSAETALDRSFLETVTQLGIKPSDMLYSDSENCGLIHNTTDHFFRSSVLSLIEKPNFQFHINEPVENIKLDKLGSNLIVGTSKRTLSPDFVIVSSGVIGTFDLLSKSDAFGKLKKQIGSKIKDHTNLRVNVLTNSPIGSINEINKSVFKKLLLLLKHSLGLKTFMTGTGATSGVHIDLDGDGKVDTRIQLVQFSESGRHGSAGDIFHNQPGFSLSITAINPRSNGKLERQGINININPNYLSAAEDRENLRRAILYCLKLLKTEPISHFVKEIIDEDIMRSNPNKYIHDNVFSGHHLIGGTTSILNDDLSVKDLPNVFICDASVFSAYAASNIHSSVVLLADAFAKKFIQNNLTN